jgi:hypothetical protein
MNDIGNYLQKRGKSACIAKMSIAKINPSWLEI